MLKNFTFDRLKLKYHIETRILDGWAVRIAPGGLKIKETSQDISKMGPLQAGTIQQFFSSLSLKDGNLISQGPVIDMTGLAGKIFLFNWNPGIIPPFATAGGGPRAGGVNVNGANVPTVDYSPPLEKQLEEQLGLTIEKGKVPVPYLVVDHLERPSEN
jgi:bla regulator protein BlaR1